MKGFNFKGYEATYLEQWLRATALVESIAEPENDDDIRCHELTRAVARVLNIPPTSVQDGWYGMVCHSWIWLDYGHQGCLLDCYAVGQLPMVQLVRIDRQTGHYSGGGMSPSLYRESPPRTDINDAVVTRLANQMLVHLKAKT